MDLSPAWLLGWRCLYALAFAVFPWALSPDAVVPASLDAVMLRALAGWVSLALIAALVAWVVRRPDARSWPLYTGLATLVGAFAAACALPRGTLPLGASVYALAPLAWATLIGAASRAPGSSRRVPALAALGVLLAATLTLSWSRVRSVESLWRAAVYVTPADGPAWRALVALARQRGDDDGARALLDRCEQAAPAAWECALDRAEIALRARDYTRSLRDASRVLTSRPDHPRALTLRALGLAHQTPVSPQAVDVSRLAVERSPRSADAHLALALSLDAAGHTGEARAQADTASSLGGGTDARLLQSLLALRSGDATAARQTVDAALRGAPGDARAYYTLGLVEQQAGHYNAAREAYLRSLQLDRAGYAARYNLAALTHGVGANDEARHHLELLLRDHPDDDAARSLLREIDQAPRSPAAALVPR